MRYALCTANLWNIAILVLMQLIISSSLYLLWFEYQFIEGRIFEHTLFASSSFFVGCLLGGVFLSKISTNRIRTSKGKIRYLRCVFITMFSIALFGSTLLILIDQFDDLSPGYGEIIIFIVQLGISSSFVTINVAVLILISVNHRLKMFAVL